MGISMYLGYSQSQASSTKATLSRQIEGYTALQKALNDFVHNSGDLSGHAYDSAKAYTSTVLIPLTRACILLNEAIAQATADLPSRYVAEVDSTSLHEDQLVDLIAKADQTIVRYRKLWNLEYASDRPNYSLLNSLDRQIDIQQELKRKLQEKLDKLRAFHASSPQIFSAIDGLAQAVNQGMRQAKTSWNSGTQTFDIPSRGNLGWTKAINQQWLDRKVSKTSFKEQVDSLTLAELEKKYNDVLNASNAYVGAGYDGRYAGLKVSPEEADYIRSRYVLLKAQGQMSLYHKEMFDNLRDKDKNEIDKLDIFELTDKYPYLILPRGSSFEFGSDADYAKKNYLYYRFEELMAKQVIDWRDPQFMEKLNAHINETGINPITGKPATEAEITTAKLYTPIKISSNILGVISLLAGPKVVTKYQNWKNGEIGHLKIIKGKVEGKIPLKEYEMYRKKSIHNKDSDTLTLGKYRPTILEDGTQDWTTPGPDSYIVQAGDTTYFDLGDDWNTLTKKYNLDDQGKQMFELFNKPALDDAVLGQKEIRFSHNPLDYSDSALNWEWDYLQDKYDYKELYKIGDYWYAIK
ncbi:T7SS effector LXG polymorphic toxin [Streptococcus ruminantium]|uniref:T7SS effector LXG polymorphic toxin n=1 Tax=Streptococcus ruminantium TaxID=1917441 RepID=UPI0012DF0FC6|nr:T7SS effector LXG polymorphic toxin [Streptococcus ruminantium]